MADHESYQRFQKHYAGDNPPPWDSGIVPPEVCALVEGDSPLQPGRALDVGCGTGTSSVYLARHGWNVTGVDWIETAVQRAQARAQRAGLDDDGIRFLRRDVTASAFLADHPPVDLWLDIGCLHRIDRADKQIYAAHVKRLVAPGGTLLLYGFLPDGPEDTSRGLDPDDIAALFAPEFTVTDVTTGEDTAAQTRPSAWMTLQRKEEP